MLAEEVERSRHGLAVEKLKRGVRDDTQILTLQTPWTMVPFTGPRFLFEASLRHGRGTPRKPLDTRRGAQKTGLGQKEKVGSPLVSESALQQLE